MAVLDRSTGHRVAEAATLDLTRTERHPLDSPAATAAPMQQRPPARVHVEPLAPTVATGAEPPTERRRHAAHRARRSAVIARRDSSVAHAPDRRLPRVTIETLVWAMFGAVVAFGMIAASDANVRSAALWALGLAGVVALALGLLAATGARMEHLDARPTGSERPETSSAQLSG